MTFERGGFSPALLRSVLETLEQTEADLRPPLALVAGRGVELDDAELHGARRRALLLLAAGGDPERGLVLDGRAVTALADELDAPERRAALADGLRELRDAAPGLARAQQGLDALLSDAETAWRALACALLASELASD